MERPNSQNFILTNNVNNPDSTNLVLTDDMDNPTFKKFVITTMSEINNELKRTNARLDKQDERIDKQDERIEKEREDREKDRRAILSRMDNTDFTNNTRFNNQDARFNIQDTRFSFIEDALKEIRGKIEDLGRDRAKNINIKDIIPDPLPGEEDYLKSLVAGKIPAWEKALTDAKSQCLSSLVESAIDASLGVYNFNRTLHTLHPNDDESFKKAFANSFTKEALTGPFISSSDPRIIVAELGIKGLIAGGKLCYHLYQNSKDKSELKKEWEEKINGSGNIVGYKKTIISYLRDPSEDGFDEMVKEYREEYLLSFDREDTTIHKTPGTSYVTIKYNKIPNFERYIYPDTDIYQAIKNVSSSFVDSDVLAYLPISRRSDLKDFCKRPLTEDQKKEVEWKFKLYRAFKEIGEFESKYWAGDESKAMKAGLSLIPVVGQLAGIAWGIKRINTEVQWSNNEKRLNDILLSCVSGFSRKLLEETITQREILLRIKNYADISQSPFAKYFFEKCSKNKYKNIKAEKKELFDEAFDLYQKLTNTGIANRDNYLKYGYPQELAEDNGIGLKKIFLDAIDKTKNDFKKLPNQVTDKEETITTKTMIDGKETTKIEIKHTQLNNQPGLLVTQIPNANQSKINSI